MYRPQSGPAGLHEVLELANGDTLYLDARLQNNPQQLQAVFTEEVGHHLDNVLGGADAAGDEGEIFARSLLEGRLSANNLSDLRSQNDMGVIVIDGRRVAIEFMEDGPSESSGGSSGSNNDDPNAEDNSDEQQSNLTTSPAPVDDLTQETTDNDTGYGLSADPASDPAEQDNPVSPEDTLNDSIPEDNNDEPLPGPLTAPQPDLLPGPVTQPPLDPVDQLADDLGLSPANVPPPGEQNSNSDNNGRETCDVGTGSTTAAEVGVLGGIAAALTDAGAAAVEGLVSIGRRLLGSTPVGVAIGAAVAPNPIGGRETLPINGTDATVNINADEMQGTVSIDGVETEIQVQREVDGNGNLTGGFVPASQEDADNLSAALDMDIATDTSLGTSEQVTTDNATNLDQSGTADTGNEPVPAVSNVNVTGSNITGDTGTATLNDNGEEVFVQLDQDGNVVDWSYEPDFDEPTTGIPAVDSDPSAAAAEIDPLESTPTDVDPDQVTQTPTSGNGTSPTDAADATTESMTQSDVEPGLPGTPANPSTSPGTPVGTPIDEPAGATVMPGMPIGSPVSETTTPPTTVEGSSDSVESGTPGFPIDENDSSGLVVNATSVESGDLEHSASIPDDPSKTGHIFDDTQPGHLPDTAENRELIENTVREENYLGTDQYGNQWYAEILPDGRQVWASVRGDEIRNGGANEPGAHRQYNPETGLASPN